MKDLNIRMFLLFAFPLSFAVLFVLSLRIFSPTLSPELSMAFGFLFVPFILMTYLFRVVLQGLAGIVGIFVFALLCVVVQYYYMRIQRRWQRGRGIPLVVATYLFTGLLMSMWLLFPLIGTEYTDMPQLYLQKVDKNETRGYVVHFTPQDLKEFPALKSLIESGHARMNWKDWDTFRQRYSPGSFVEYNGTYYAFTWEIPQ